MISFDDFDIELDITQAYEVNGDSVIEDLCDENYPIIIKNLLKYIDKVKNLDKSDSSLIEIIIDYSFKYNIDLRVIGDAIQDDEYLKSFIKRDSEFRGIIEDPNIEESW